MKPISNVNIFDDKQNIKYATTQKNTNSIYTNFNISNNKNNNNNMKRPKSAFKVEKTNKSLKKINYQIKDMEFLPFSISNNIDNLFINSLTKIKKKDNIGKKIKTINEFRYSSKGKYKFHIKNEDLISYLKSKKLLKLVTNKRNKKEIKLKRNEINKRDINTNNIKMNKKCFSKNKFNNNNKFISNEIKNNIDKNKNLIQMNKNEKKQKEISKKKQPKEETLKKLKILTK